MLRKLPLLICVLVGSIATVYALVKHDWEAFILVAFSVLIGWIVAHKRFE